MEKEIVVSKEDTDKITPIFIETTELEISIQELLSRADEILSQKFTVLNINDELNVQPENQVLPDRTRHSKGLKLPSIEIKSFSGELTEWLSFYDSYEAAIHNSSELSGVQRFTYLRSYLTDAALKSVSGLILTNKNYGKFLTILKKLYGNKQAIVSTHMEKLVNLRVVTSDANKTGLRKLFDEIESNVRSLESLGVETNSYGLLLVPIIMNRLPHQLKLAVSRNVSSDLWDLTELLKIIKLEITAREICEYNSDRIGKNDNFMSEDCLGSASALYSQSKKRAKTCVFCKGDHWSDRWSVITDMEVRKILLINYKRCFICLNQGRNSQNCLKKNGCCFCKGLYNSTIGNNKDKKETPENTNVNFSSSEKDFVLLQTAEVNLFNKSNSAEVKVKILFDPGSE